MLCPLNEKELSERETLWKTQTSPEDKCNSKVVSTEICQINQINSSDNFIRYLRLLFFSVDNCIDASLSSLKFLMV